MLADFIFSVNAVLPLFAIMLAGYIMKRVNFVSASFFTGVTKIVFYIALPAALFRNVYISDVQELLDWPFVVLVVGLSVASFGLIWAVGALIIREKGALAAFVQGCWRGNFAFLGLPLLVNLAGDAGLARGTLIITFALPIWNICSILVLSIYGKGKIGVKTVLYAIAKNPFIIAISIGLIFVLAGISLPLPLERTVGYAAATATPLALLTLGGGLVFAAAEGRTKFKLVIIGSLIKVLVLPIAFLLVGYAFGFRGVDLAAILVMGGVPGAVVGYAMVVQMGGDGYIAGMIVAISTIMSAISLTLLIYFSRILGLF
jgi:predicted permease